MVFESLLAYSRQQSDALSKRVIAPLAGSFGFAMGGPAGEVYDEEAFHHFLDIERTRTQRSEGALLLVLVSLRKNTGSSVIPREWSSVLFSGLAHCVRDIDFIGWYRDQRIAGAVLAQGLEIPSAEAMKRIAERVTKILRHRLPAATADRLRVRIIQLGPRAK